MTSTVVLSGMRHLLGVFVVNTTNQQNKHNNRHITCGNPTLQHSHDLSQTGNRRNNCLDIKKAQSARQSFIVAMFYAAQMVAVAIGRNPNIGEKGCH